MTAIQSRQAALAIAYALRTGATPKAAGKRYGVSARTVQRGLRSAGAARPPGRQPREAHSARQLAPSATTTKESP